jgi:hypothetical protein
MRTGKSSVKKLLQFNVDGSSMFGIEPILTKRCREKFGTSVRVHFEQTGKFTGVFHIGITDNSVKEQCIEFFKGIASHLTLAEWKD